MTDRAFAGEVCRQILILLIIVHLAAAEVVVLILVFLRLWSIEITLNCLWWCGCVLWSLNWCTASSCILNPDIIVVGPRPPWIVVNTEGRVLRKLVEDTLLVERELIAPAEWDKTLP